MLPQIRNHEEKINDEVYLEFTRYETDHDGFGGLQMMRAVVNETLQAGNSSFGQ